MKKIFTILVAFLFAGLFTVQAQETQKVTFWPTTYNTEAKDYEYTYESFKSDIVRNADGSYTIKNFTDSDVPLTFKFTPEVAGYTDITFAGNIYVDEEYGEDPYVMTADGKDYAELMIYDYETGDDVPIYYPYVSEDGYSYAYTYDKEDEDFDPATDKDYYCVICMNGQDAKGDYLPWIYVTFWFNEMAIPAEDPSGVAAVGSDNNAPVEYFNLQGMKVANPENGVFIRRQGSKVQKIVR